MPFKPGISGNPDGKPKGAKNRFTILKNAWADTFEKMGGADGLLEWASHNKKEFYEMMVRLMPKELQVDGDLGGGTKIILIKEKNAATSRGTAFPDEVSGERG